MHASVLIGTLGFVAVCHGFVPSSFTSSLSRHSLGVASSSHSLRAASVKFARERKCSAVTMQGGDELSGMFSGSEQLAFDPRWTDPENIAINGAKATKVTESDPAFAVFGSDSTSGIQRYGVKILQQVHSLHIGVLVNPRTPSRPCWADTLRTPAVMIGKGGSVYRTGRLGTKMLEYLGPELKKTMGKSYPPKFVEGDTVNMELNKDTQELKMWINDNAPFTIGGIDKQAKFFVNMEGVLSAVEIVRIN